LDNKKITYLLKQMKQQERIISQLVKIVANTNNKVINLEHKVEQLESLHTFRKI